MIRPVMALDAGTVLGSYEVLEPIGAGGMGEVYRARDGKLGCDVAIKILPEGFSQDEARRKRFEREARVLASLNHENIGAIYGLEQDEEKDLHFLVLELIPGETLAERLRSGPLPVEEAIRIARQIVAALEAAHEQGVVHRDLKPANIKITPTGRVKVLDFGLAKAFGVDERSAELSNSPTLSMAATREGIILGTAAYMSPEQAKGMAVDKRSDVFAFGSVLFEMLTGRKAFEGEMASEVLASVIKSDLDFTGLPANLHPRVREILTRSLEKDRQKRWRDIGDIAVELDALAASPEGVVVEPRSAGAGARSRPFVLSAVALAAFAGGVVFWSLVAPSSSSSAPVVRLALRLNKGTTMPGSASVVLSPDDTMLAYTATAPEVGGSALYLRPLDQLETRLLPGTDGARAPFFSPDGEWIAFFAGDDLRKVSVRGGGSIKICDAPGPVGSKAGTWGPDGTIVFHFAASSGLWRVPGTGGTAEQLTSPAAEDGETEHWLPQWLPNGKGILLDVVSSDGTRVDVLSIPTGERRTLVRPGSRGQYLRTGHVVYSDSGNVFAIPFDADRLEVEGAPIPVMEGVRRRTGVLTCGPPTDAASLHQRPIGRL